MERRKTDSFRWGCSDGLTDTFCVKSGPVRDEVWEVTESEVLLPVPSMGPSLLELVAGDAYRG